MVGLDPTVVAMIEAASVIVTVEIEEDPSDALTKEVDSVSVSVVDMDTGGIVVVSIETGSVTVRVVRVPRGGIVVVTVEAGSLTVVDAVD